MKNQAKIYFGLLIISAAMIMLALVLTGVKSICPEDGLFFTFGGFICFLGSLLLIASSDSYGKH